MTPKRWTALVVIVAIAVGLLVAIVVVPWSDDAPAEKATPVYHEGASIDVAVGDEFVVALPATPSTGYSWTAAGNPDVTFVSTHQVAGDARPGAEGTQELTFRGRQAGDSPLVLTYARPFEKAEPPAKTTRFPLTITQEAGEARARVAACRPTLTPAMDGGARGRPTSSPRRCPTRPS